MCETHCLFPRPVTGHHVAVLPPLAVEFLIGRIIDVALKVRTSKKVLDNLARVPVPDVVPRCLPFRRTGRLGERAIVLEASVLPLNISNLDRIDLTMEISVVDDGRRAAMGNERGCPQLEEVVNPSPRKLGIGVHELCEFEPGPRCKRGPIVARLGGWGFWWNVGGDKIAVLITAQACEE